MINGSTTSACGGDLGSLLVIQLAEIDQAVNGLNYNWETCALHALSQMMKFPIEEVTGKGGLTKRTFLQLLHTAYNSRQSYVTKIRINVWKAATNSD